MQVYYKLDEIREISLSRELVGDANSWASLRTIEPKSLNVEPSGLCFDKAIQNANVH